MKELTPTNDVKASQNDSMGLSEWKFSVSKINVNDAGYSIDNPNHDSDFPTGRKLIYTPFSQTVHLALPNERFHYKTYERALGRNDFHPTLQSGDVWTGALMPGNNVMWYFTGNDVKDERQLVEQALGHNNWNYDEGFKFGDFKTAIGYGPPEIVEYEFNLDPGKGEPYDEFRRPFLYEPSENIVHVGPMGALHASLANEAEIPYRNAGAIMHDSNFKPNRSVALTTIPDEVMDEVHRNFGTSDQGDDYRFANSNHKLDWEPGTKGKGWVFEDGTVWTWPVDEKTLRPYHRDMLSKARNQGLEPFQIRDDDGWLTETGAIHIAEDGNLVNQMKRAMPIVQRAKAADPRLRTLDDPWTFG